MIISREKWGEGIVRDFGIDTYTLLYLKWITNKDLLYSTGNSAQCYVAAWMGGEFGGERIHAYVWLSPFAMHLKLSQHCELAILQYKTKSLKKSALYYLGLSFYFYCKDCFRNISLMAHTTHGCLSSSFLCLPTGLKRTKHCYHLSFSTS